MPLGGGSWVRCGATGFTDPCGNAECGVKGAVPIGLVVSITSLLIYATDLLSSNVLFTDLLRISSTFLGGERPLEVPGILSGDLRLT